MQEEEEEAPVMAEVVGTPFVVEEEDAKDAMMTMEADQHLLIKRYQRGLAACHLAATTALHRRSSLLKGLIHFEDKRFAWVWGVWAGMAKRQQAKANRARLLKTTALVHRHANASRVIQSALNVWKYSIIRARYNTASQAVLEASINFHQQQQGHKAFKRWRMPRRVRDGSAQEQLPQHQQRPLVPRRPLPPSARLSTFSTAMPLLRERRHQPSDRLGR